MDLQNISKMIEAGSYEEALQGHLKFHEESKLSPGMTGVRLSFALSQWVKLGNKYNKALLALKEIRDSHETMLMAGKGGFPEYHEYYAICRTLNENDKPYELFLILHEKYKDIADKCFGVIEETLFEKKDYDICAMYIVDPIKKYEDIRSFRELNMSMIRANKQFDNEMFRKHTDDTYINGTRNLLRMVVYKKRIEEAKEIKKRAMQYFESDEISHIEI